MVTTKQITCRNCEPGVSMSYSYGTIDANYPKPALPYFARSNRPTTTQGYRQTSASRFDNSETSRKWKNFTAANQQRQISPPPILDGLRGVHGANCGSKTDPKILTMQRNARCTHAAQGGEPYSRSSRSTRSRRSRNFTESFRAILEGFRNALQGKIARMLHSVQRERPSRSSRNFKGFRKFQSGKSRHWISCQGHFITLDRHYQATF